jgi:hypothetical protein
MWKRPTLRKALSVATRLRVSIFDSGSPLATASQERTAQLKNNCALPAFGWVSGWVFRIVAVAQSPDQIGPLRPFGGFEAKNLCANSRVAHTFRLVECMRFHWLKSRGGWLPLPGLLALMRIG